MATSFPPSEYFNGIIYNPAFYQTNLQNVTLAYINANFLKSIGVALSTATITTFTGAVSIGGLLSITGGISLSGGLSVDNLTVNGTSSFIGQSTFTLVPILPANYQFLTTLTQNISGIKSFTSTINTVGITDTVSISSPTVTASNIIYLNQISNLSSTLPYTLSCGTISLPSGINTNSGLQIGWNGNPGNGETDFTNLAQGGGGGFQFGTISNTLTYRALCTINPYSNQGFWLFSNCGRLRIDDRNGGAFWWGQSQEGSQMLCSVNGISTSFTVGCGNSSGVGSTCLSINTSEVSPNVNFSPLSTSTFNVFHPTTTLGNNLSSNTTQYATVGYVNTTIGPSLLSSNNVWVGTNSYTQNQISIGSGVQVYVGNSTGNQQSIVIGDPLSLATTTVSTNCISVGTLSLRSSTGANNISLGTANLTVLNTGNQNIAIGNSSGGGITTGSNNIIIGTSSWTTGNFSNCTVIGSSVPAPLANNSIILGGTTETVYINGSSQLNNTLLYGTTVASNNLQVNGNIIQPIQTFTAGVTTTFTILPPFVFFTPAPSGMAFIWPLPSAANAGQTFTIRRIASGSGITINNTIVGNVALWFTTNSGTGVANIAISTVWSFTFISNGSGYYQIA